MASILMSPAPGERRLHFVGDRIRFTLQAEGVDSNGKAFLRTTLGRARVYFAELISSSRSGRPLKGAFWWDIPMEENNGQWQLELPLAEVGYFAAKAYWLDAQGRQHWPAGSDAGISVHPDRYRTGNIIYCAFTRMFGKTKTRKVTREVEWEEELKSLDRLGYTVIPASGTFRDLIGELPHIFDTLGCRILHLLPVHPTPTTMARFGRFGSPYATLDLTAVDLALVEFDKRTTGVDQFCELTYKAHEQGGRVFLDMVINHTGWGARLQETHPEWYVRNATGDFVSPGAWGVTWEDLAELDPRYPELWEELAEAFLTWCRRGVDGFRCDAGYKVPTPVWQYIISRVRQEFPETIFLLEGLGGSWKATETLLTHGGMQWAYSELFQNHSGQQIADYLDYSLKQSATTGLYVHYSETHDNDRLARRGRAWSLLRNRLCALTSSCGGFGFTCGVEWLASEKLEVHQSRGLSWGNSDNLIDEISDLNRLLTSHPCFFDDAKVKRLSDPDSVGYALERLSGTGEDRLMVLVNPDIEAIQSCVISRKDFEELGSPPIDFFGQPLPLIQEAQDTHLRFIMEPGAVYCLSNHTVPAGMSGVIYRDLRALSASALTAVAGVIPLEAIGPFEWQALAKWFDASPRAFLASLSSLEPARSKEDLLPALKEASEKVTFPRVVTWTPEDVSRIFLVPPEHWLLLEDSFPFRASFWSSGKPIKHLEAVKTSDGFVAFTAPRFFQPGDVTLKIERYQAEPSHLEGVLRFLGTQPQLAFPAFFESPAGSDSLLSVLREESVSQSPVLQAGENDLVLLTNGRGAMARICVDLGRIRSKYDAVLAANLHACVPVDRHVLVKRVRAWVNADGFVSPLDFAHLIGFRPGPPARWEFKVSAGDGRSVGMSLLADMVDEENTTVLLFERGKEMEAQSGLPESSRVSLILRVDIEDRNFHFETRRNPGADHHFRSHCHAAQDGRGFSFTPAADRHLHVFTDAGVYHPEEEWSHGIEHPVEGTRGQPAMGDAYSPGWFEIPLTPGAKVNLVATAESKISWERITVIPDQHLNENKLMLARSGLPAEDRFGVQLLLAAKAFLVRRDRGKTVIAGYPWFLDWGRDSLICARGLLAGGWRREVADLLAIFGRFVEGGTMPNTIHGEDASNRDTVDAPLWYGIVCEELAALHGPKFYQSEVQPRQTIEDVLIAIAQGYLSGTHHRIRVDSDSGLVWSPSHFTWMDTSFPAGTPREGYPVEIQVLWIRLLRQLTRIEDSKQASQWQRLAKKAEDSFHSYYWLEKEGYLADSLQAAENQPAASAVVDRSLRSNYLFAISLGIVEGERARRSVEAALRYLVVPGALRTLAPLPVSPPLPIYSAQGTLLNEPGRPYAGRYEGDEDTRRKPAYHNGTAWTWTFPVFCEALVRAWNFSEPSVEAARAYLGSMDQLLNAGCVGQIPEIVDGDAPHQQRGCDAQAWGVTEALRVWKLLHTGREVRSKPAKRAKTKRIQGQKPLTPSP